MIFIGIDPGLNGAIAFLNVEKGHLSVVDMPTFEVKRNNKLKREVSPHGIADVLPLEDLPLTDLSRYGAVLAPMPLVAYAVKRASGPGARL